MTPRDKAMLGGLITVVCVVSIPLMFWLLPMGSQRPVADDATATVGASSAPAVPVASVAPTVEAGGPSVTNPSQPSLSAAPTAAVPALVAAKPALGTGSPRETLETQRRLLETRDDAAFRATFMPEVQSKLTSEAIEACRKRLVGKELKPDWEVAEQSVESADSGGQGLERPHKVLRVSIFGKSMTGFHEVAPDRWLADAAWCIPVF